MRRRRPLQFLAASTLAAGVMLTGCGGGGGGGDAAANDAALANTPAVTPAAGHVTPISAIVIGLIATFPSYYALQVRPRTKLDDSLDVFAGHGLGGISGALLTGVFASAEFGGPGLLGGEPKLLLTQALAVVAAMVFSAAGTWVILKGISLLMPLRASDKEERVGLDLSAHGEEAYVTGEGAILILPESLPKGLREKTEMETIAS